MHHSSFIAALAAIYKPKVYVELGLYQGETLRKVQPYIEKGYGIDMKPNAELEQLKQCPNLHIQYTTTDAFFANYAGTIDMAFIDADHCYESAKRDFVNVLSRLNPGGLILLHDTDPISDDYIHPGYCGDSYKMVPWLEQRDDLNVTTLPIEEAGLSIVTLKGKTRTQLRQKVCQKF